MRERLLRWLGSEAPLRRGVTLLGTSILCALLLARPSLVPELRLEEGEVASRDLIAPIAFSYEDHDATEDAALLAEQAIAPVYSADLTLTRQIENRLSQAFDLARRRYASALEQANGDATALDPADRLSLEADFLTAIQLPVEAEDLRALWESGFSEDTEKLALELVATGFRDPIIADRSLLPNPPREIAVITVRGEEREEAVLTDYSRIRAPEEARQAISLKVVEQLAATPHPERVRAAGAIARLAVVANLSANPVLTQERRQSARERTQTVEVRVPKGARLLRAGEVLHRSDLEALDALRVASRQSSGLWSLASFFVFSLVILATLVGFAQATVRKFAHRTQDLDAMAFALVIILGIGRLLAAAHSYLASAGVPLTWTPLLVPVAGGTMLIRILLNSESALIWTLAASLLVGARLDGDVLLTSTYLVTGLVAATGVGPARERLVVLRAGLQSGLVGAGFVVVAQLLQGQEGVQILSSAEAGPVLTVVAAAVAGGLFSAVLALGVVPAFEMFGFITDYKLQELASLNHPLLKQLMLRAPGTYHHSMIVGSLSEAACEAIGANALLARVACYFHDIGKGVKPQYFVENQREGGNKHERLSPEQSAQVIINHVRDGAVLAIQHRLPKAIYDNIFMHHGTGLIQYFYSKAKEQAGPDQVVDERLFRYPGPKPDTREAGIIMLADKVEAACRTIQSPTEDRIRAMIQQIINSVMLDGQLENCPLTLRELYQIADTFVNVLLGIYHHRIEYPDTRAISSGKGKVVPIPKQGTITLEILNPAGLRPSPPAAPAAPVVPAAPVAPAAPAASPPVDEKKQDYEAVENLPHAGGAPRVPRVDDA